MAGRKAKTVAERAADEGISVSTLRRRMKCQTQSTVTPELLTWRERKEKAEALKAEKFLDMLDGDFLPRATVEAQQARIGHVCNALLRAFVSEFPPLGAGLSAPEIEAKAKAWVLAWAGKLADADSDVWTAAERDVSREMRGDAKKIAVAKSRKRV